MYLSYIKPSFGSKTYIINFFIYHNFTNKIKIKIVTYHLFTYKIYKWIEYLEIK